MSEEQPVRYMSLGGNDTVEALNVRFLENGMVKYDSTDGEEVVLSEAIFNEIYIPME